MPDLPTMTAVLLSIAQTHDNLSEMYAQLALLHMDPIANMEVMTLARAIQGEGAGDFGEKRDELAIWIAHTSYNRWEKPWWKRIGSTDCTFSARVEYDWHGTQNVSLEEVEPWAIRIAHQVRTARRNGGIDRANGAVFGMTLEDLLEHGWQERAHELKVHVIPHPDDPLVQFWFLSDYPGPEVAR